MRFIWHHIVEAGEADALGHASNVAFVDWIQRAAIAHSAAVGWPLERYKTFGAAFMVRTHHVEYLGQALPGDAIEVATWVETIDRASSLRAFEIRSGEKLICRGNTRWAFVDLERGRPVALPREIADAFTSPPPGRV